MAHDVDIAKLSSEIALESPPRDADARRQRTELRVTDVSPEGGYKRVWLDAPQEWRDGHETPGQYITARFGTSRYRFLVLANAPFESAEAGYELLIEPNDDLTPLLEALRPGDHVLASAPEGDGFLVDRGREVGMVATGSGIAGLRPVLSQWHRFEATRPQSVVIYYEEEGGVSHAYRTEIEGWADAGWLEAHFVSHQDKEPFVAERISYDGFADESELLLCGSPAMIAAVSSRALMHGFTPERIHTNI